MRNTWAIYLDVGDSLPKGGVIPNVVVPCIRHYPKVGILRNLPRRDEPASYQLVGEVMAHQGRDG